MVTDSLTHSLSSEPSKTLYLFAPLNILVVLFFSLRIAISYVVLPVIVEDWFMILLNTLPVMSCLASDSYSSFVQINFSLCWWWISLVAFYVKMSLSLSQLGTNSINTVPSFMYCRTKWYLVSTCFVLSLLFWFSAKNIAPMFSTCTWIGNCILLVDVSKGVGQIIPPSRLHCKPHILLQLLIVSHFSVHVTASKLVHS